MNILKGAYTTLKNNQPLTLCIGNFDGVHAGHQQLIQSLFLFNDTKHAVMTFDPHPLSFLKKSPFYTLMKSEDKLAIFASFHVDLAILVTFDEAFATLSKEDFISFLKALSVKRLVVGRDFKFASHGMGSVEDLKQHFEVYVVPDQLDHHIRISTSYIKDLLQEGEIHLANTLLTRSYRISGHVVHGNQVGTLLGFKTANIDYDHYILPKDGVYKVFIVIDGISYLGMANIGNNPTVNYQEKKRLEVHIFHFDRTLYGQTVSVDFISYIRSEQKFSSKEALILQLEMDKIKILHEK